MYINKNLVDSISLDRKKIKYPGYIGGFTRLLKQKHHLIISEGAEEPEFIVRSKLHASSNAKLVN
jgi:hypothetical protein